MKWIATVNGIPIEELTKEQRKKFENYVLGCIKNMGYRVHKKTKQEASR